MSKTDDWIVRLRTHQWEAEDLSTELVAAIKDYLGEFNFNLQEMDSVVELQSLAWKLAALAEDLDEAIDDHMQELKELEEKDG